MELHTLGGETMGTHWSVRIAAPHHADLALLHRSIEQPLARVVQQMSTWEPDSHISRFNNAPAGSWHFIPQEFFEVLRCAIQIARVSDGAFDPSVGTLVGLWGFGAHAHAETPSASTLQHARQLLGWQRIELDEQQQRLYQPGGLQLDLSAIAKGFAADLVAAQLKSAGITGALIDIGGELVGFGHKPDGKYWSVLVEAGPEEDDHQLPPRILALNNLAVATSGDRWHHYTRDGRHYTHTVDPRSGQPLEHTMAAVSVISSSAMQADAWATALSVLGAETGYALAQQLQIGARFLTRHNNTLHERMTPHFQQALAA